MIESNYDNRYSAKEKLTYMDDFWSLSLVTILASAILICILLTYAILYRQERGVRYFVWVLGFRVIYAGSVILEINREDMQSKLLFRNIEQTSLLFMVPFMVLFVLDLIGKDKWLKPQWSLSLIALFACWGVVLWADPYWHLIIKTQQLINGHLVIVKTPYAFAFNLLCYCIIAGCIFLLIRYILNSRPEFRVAGLWLLLFGSIPMALEIVKLFNPAFSPWLLPLTVYCGIFGMIMLWIIIRKQIFSSVPVARNIVIETMREGMLITNTSGKIIDSNHLARLLLERAPNYSILGRQCEDVLSAWPKWRDACISMEECQIEIDTVFGQEKKAYIINVYPYLTQRQRKLGTISIIIDITDKQQALEHIAHLNQMKDQLFTAVSHDIRNPLATGVNLLEILEQEQSDTGKIDSEIIHALGEQIRNTYTIVENLMEWFRGQKEGIILHPEAILLSQIIEEANRLLVINLELKQISLHIDISDDIYVYADREALILVIRNLLSNAVKYTLSGGIIEVNARKIGARVEISVSDNGIGMTEEQIRHIFDETRISSTSGTAGEKGTGLGLLVSRQFLHMCGGYLTVHSKLGSGSTFTIVLKERDNN